MPALLEAGHRVIAVDLRGHGRSSVPEDGHHPRQFAADVAALLRDLGTGPVIAAGHSLGGAVVVALAVEHPDLVRAIVPIDSAYGMSPDGMDERRTALVQGLAAPGGHEMAIAMFAGFYTPESPVHLQTWHRRRVEGCPSHVLSGVIAGLLTHPEQFSIRPEATEYLGRVTAPALAVRAGRADSSDLADTVAWEAGAFRHPYSKVVGWEVGHWPHQERPEEFNRLLLEWIEGLPE